MSLTDAAPTVKSDDDEPNLVARSLLVLALCCAIGALCSLDRVMISIAILPMGDEYGFSDSTKVSQPDPRVSLMRHASCAS